MTRQLRRGGKYLTNYIIVLGCRLHNRVLFHGRGVLAVLRSVGGLRRNFHFSDRRRQKSDHMIFKQHVRWQESRKINSDASDGAQFVIPSTAWQGCLQHLTNTHSTSQILCSLSLPSKSRQIICDNQSDHRMRRNPHIISCKSPIKSQ